ncbi:conserved hypothetical protein [Exiguobacterium sp. 8H]|uniref:hypothetical protein n=1 Tax=unclassified Exiguobacterium TaxID=2644629 RepID=UPI0012F1FAB3|nr:MULTISPECIES: hypothetical protein [unclassified Exiguobacterium]VXB19706.1 conserved hypothetical protein [Exiguobacterium sp. 8H]VXB20738.1 conserved hypothetical protein [Exiguobacterium sp. 8A]
MNDEIEVVDSDARKSLGSARLVKTNHQFYIHWNGLIMDFKRHEYVAGIRIIDENHLFIWAFTLEGEPINAWVLDADGDIKHSFHAGNAIAVVVINETGIWIGYGDEGIFGEGVSTEALVCLSTEGAVRFRYNQEIRKAPVLHDCDVMCASEKGVWVISSIDGRLVHVQVDGRIDSYPMPRHLLDCSSLTIENGVAYVGNEEKIYRWPFKERRRAEVFQNETK